MKARLEAAELTMRQAVAATLSPVRRISAGPALVRLVAAVSALGALTLALPLRELSSAAPSVLIGLAAVLVAVSVGVALLPRTRFVSWVALAAIVVWLISTIGYGEAVTLPRVGLLAAALYLTHAAAALAAVLPYDCLIAAGLLLRWLGRVGSVLGLSLLTGLAAMALTSQLPAIRSVAGPIVGSVVAAGLAGLLAWHLRRGRE